MKYVVYCYYDGNKKKVVKEFSDKKQAEWKLNEMWDEIGGVDNPRFPISFSIEEEE